MNSARQPSLLLLFGKGERPGSADNPEGPKDADVLFYPWPALSAAEWNDKRHVANSTLRRTLGHWEEYQDKDTNEIFFVDTDVVKFAGVYLYLEGDVPYVIGVVTWAEAEALRALAKEYQPGLLADAADAAGGGGGVAPVEEPDVRVLAVTWTPGGSRLRFFREAVQDMDHVDFGDSPLEGPATASWFLREILASGER